MEKQEFENSLSVKYWMDSLPGKDGPCTTKYVWKHHVKRFCDWIGKTPDQLINERKEHLKSEDKRVNHQVEMDVKRFLSYLEDEGLSPATIRAYFMGIRNFYKRNYLELAFFRGDAPQSHTVREGARASSKDDIRKMLEVSNPRVRALILFLKDTGLGESDLVKLKLKDLGVKQVADIFTLQPPVPLVLYRKKTGRKTITFIGEEAFNTFKTTLKIRQVGTPEMRIKRYGKKEVKKGVAPETLTLESPLFRSYHKMLTNRSEIKHLSSMAISTIIRGRAKVAGIWKKGFGAHALRRFFQTSLETSGMQQNWIKKMMGHALGGSEAPYSRPEIETLRSAYAKSYPYLAITEKVEQKSRVQALESQMEALIMNGKTKDLRIRELESQQTGITEKTVALENLLERIEKLEKNLAEKSEPTART